MKTLNSIPSELKEEVEAELGESFEWKKLDKGLNDIYKLSSYDSVYILKVHTNPKNKIPWFKAEPRIYDKISEETDIPSPKVIYKDLSCEDYQDMFYIMESMEGENLQNIREELNQEELGEILHQFGIMLGKTHELQITDHYGIIGFEDGVFGSPDSAEQWNWAMEGSMSAWKEITTDEWEEPTEIEFDPEKVNEKLPRKPKSVLLHSDNRLDNLLVDESTITGFLDWSHPWSGHKVYDLIKTEYLLIERDLGEWDKELDTEKLKEKFYSGYKREAGDQREDLNEEIKQIYRYAITLELSAGFANWGSKLDDKEHEEMREDIIESIKEEEPNWNNI